MEGERKIKKLIGKTVKNISANQYRLVIAFEDGTILHYHMMTDDKNHIEFPSTKRDLYFLKWDCEDLFEE